MREDNTSDHQKVIMKRVLAQLEELAPAINAFSSEAVQEHLIDKFVIPKLLEADIDAGIESLVSLTARLTKGDPAAQVEFLSQLLRVLI